MPGWVCAQGMGTNLGELDTVCLEETAQLSCVFVLPRLTRAKHAVGGLAPRKSVLSLAAMVHGEHAHIGAG